MSSAPSNPDAFIGLDLGTSGLKAVALDGDGRIIARTSNPYRTLQESAGAYEQDPQDWYAAAALATRQLSSAIGRSASIRGIGLSAMMPTLVPADSAANPLGPAITWQDDRGEEEGRRLRDAVGAERLYSATGQWLDGRYLLPMYVAWRAREPASAAGANLLGAKDWLVARLTGQVATDPSTAAGIGAYELEGGGWYQPLLDAAQDAAGIEMPGLPDVLGADTLLQLSASAAVDLGLPSGLPVAVGAADSVLGAYGLGVSTPGSIAYIAGTSTAIIGIAKQWAPDPQHRYLGTPLAEATMVGLEMDLLATGSAIRWLARLLRLSGEDELMRLARGVPIQDAPTVLPYLSPGEQGALWDPHLTGAVTGLTLATGPAEVARGLLNSLVVESRRCTSILRAAGMLGPLVVAGGSAGDEAFRADLADATGYSVLAPTDADSDLSALGAARLVASATGQPIMAAASLTGPVDPRADRAELWAQIAEGQDRVRTSLTRSRAGSSRG